MAEDLQGAAVDPESATNSRFDSAMSDVDAAIHGSGSIDDALAALRDVVRDQLIADGLSAEDAEDGANAFRSQFETSVFKENKSVEEAAVFGQRATDPKTGDEINVSTGGDPIADLILALSTGENVDDALDAVVKEAGGEDLDAQDFKDEIVQQIQQALVDGVPQDRIAEQAADTARSAFTADEQGSVPVQNDVISALAGNGDIDKALDQAADKSGGDKDAFLANLENSLAENEDADSAVAGAGQAARDTQAAKDEAKVEISAQDQFVQNLAAGGENAKEALDNLGGGKEFADTLNEALGGGAPVADAFSQAEVAQDTANTVRQDQSVPIDSADQFVAALSNGDREVVSKAIEEGGEAFAESVEQGLQSGQSAGEAMARGQQAQEAQSRAEADQSVPLTPGQQLAADMALGNTEAVDEAVAAGGKAFADNLGAEMAGGATPDQALTQATTAQQSADAAVADSTVPADPAATALAQGGEATEGVDLAAAVQEATGTTGGETDTSTQTQTAETTTTETTTTETTTQATTTETTSTETTSTETASTETTTTTETTTSTETADASGTTGGETTETTVATESGESTGGTQTAAAETGDTTGTGEEGGTGDPQVAGAGEAVSETTETPTTTETGETTETPDETQTQTAAASEGDGSSQTETPEDGSTTTGSTEEGEPGDEVTEEIQTVGETPEDGQGNGQGDGKAAEGEDGEGGEGDGDTTQLASNQPVGEEGGGGDLPTQERPLHNSGIPFLVWILYYPCAG